MPFITQGKTNWKFILIVLILAILVGGGILGYLRYFEKETVSLTKFLEIKKTEKKELNKEEISKTEEKELDIDVLLHKLFPNITFKNGVAKLDSIFPGLKLYLKEKIEDYFTSNKEKNLLIIAELEGVPHAGGLYHAFLGLFDKNGNLLTPTSCFPDCEFFDDKTHFGGDEGEFKFFDCKGIKYIVFIGKRCSVGSCCTGWVDVYKVNNGQFEKIQSDEDLITETSVNSITKTSFNLKQIFLPSVFAAGGPPYDLIIKQEGKKIIIKKVPSIARLGETEPCPETYYGELKWNEETCKFELVRKEEALNWKTYRDKEYRFEIKYPEKLNTEFIHIDFIDEKRPPKVIINPDVSEFVCEEREGLDQMRVFIEDQTYCRVYEENAGAGHLYATYSFSTVKEGKQITLEFTIDYPGCKNYVSDDEIKRCSQERKNFDPYLFAHQILSTFRFLK